MKMKKVLALVFVLMMIVPVAMGDVEAKQELNWETISAMDAVQAMLPQGQFVTLDRYGVSLWLHGSMQPVENTEYSYEYADETGALHFVVKEEPVPDEVNTTEDLIAYIEKNVADKGLVTPTKINGLFCMNYTANEGDTAVVTLIGSDRTIVSFAFMNMSNESVNQLNSLIIASIQPAAK